MATAAADGPTRFASREPLDRGELTAAELRSLPRPSLLEEPLDVRHRRTAAALATLGIETPRDLLEHLPFRHHERARPIVALAPGEKGTVVGEIRRVSKRRSGRGKSIVEATLADETGVVKAIWFNQPWLADQLAPGARIALHGKRSKRNEFWVASYDLAAGVTADASDGMAPVYPATEGITPDRLRELVKRLRGHERHVVDPLPARMRAAERLPDRPAALTAQHFPEDEGEVEPARRRLAFEELLVLKLALLARKRARREAHAAAVLEPTGELVGPWLESLPFEPTRDQRAAMEAIDSDVCSGRAMQRLLMGEVGSGKTVVALHAMLRAAENGRQAALMAPTETLAEQHLATLDRLLGGHLPIALLTGSTPAARRREIGARLETGELRMVVGTHALIEPGVEFADLALAVVDEQHRFGVRQRAALESKAPPGSSPHVLHLTATPIPRTLQLTLYGDLDATALRELPAGRKAVETHVVSGARARARAYERAREEIRAGRQVFVVCPLVEESDALQAAAATAEAERLQATEFRAHRVELIHGQMPSARKAEAMRAFASGEADVLVATSVIEVGIDVPNAAVMLIEAAERYGISQLHQLRGRIGRGRHPGLCVLFGDPAQARLRALAEERDGFRLAEIDLALRKGGEVLGTRQHGYQEFRVARLPDDAELLERAQTVALRTLTADPGLEAPEHALLRDEVAARFGPAREPIPA